jgi:hypothetical protein
MEGSHSGLTTSRSLVFSLPQSHFFSMPVPGNAFAGMEFSYRKTCCKSYRGLLVSQRDFVYLCLKSSRTGRMQKQETFSRASR